MTKHYYRGTCGYIIACSATNVATWESLKKWQKDFEVNGNSKADIPFIIILTKIDDVADEEEIKKKFEKFYQTNFAYYHNCLGWEATSSKDNINIHQSVSLLVEKFRKIRNESWNTYFEHPEIEKIYNYDVPNEGKPDPIKTDEAVIYTKKGGKDLLKKDTILKNNNKFDMEIHFLSLGNYLKQLYSAKFQLSTLFENTERPQYQISCGKGRILE
jgi:hypothetical protein